MTAPIAVVHLFNLVEASFWKAPAFWMGVIRWRYLKYAHLVFTVRLLATLFLGTFLVFLALVFWC